ncbi:MAG: ribosome biogenesis GTPase Der [Clostridia bacterium]|nr:ribosome biogenesis GTPase Der [Clostridia bacterium]MBQ5802378.1 ribosome biogenesis GTPase Der [Clostridia bacterium]
MAKPLVALVGRPNVGKSTFFNKVTGKRLSIVENRPGVTRDRLYADAEWCGKNFTLVDTGGLELKSEDEMWRHILKQAEIAIETAQVIVFMTDAKTGLTSSDYDVADKLRRSGKPVVLAVNKWDNYHPEQLYDFYCLGLGEPYGISSELGKGIGDLLDEVCSHFDAVDDSEEEDVLKIAVLGKPNAGKSSICNRLLGFERTIVSDIAGTTRDAIDTPFTYKGKKYLLIDTAGIRKKSNVEEDVEYYSVLRAFGAVRRADVCIAVIDSTLGITEQDTKICGYIHEQGKPSVIVMNKWDLVEKDTNTVNEYKKDVATDLAFMDYVETVFVSAKTGQRAEKIIEYCERAVENANFRVKTGILNDLVMDAVRTSEPPSYQGRRLKIQYCVQAEVAPPTFVFFVNDSGLVHFSYRRYLENCLRRAFNFTGTPIRLVFRQKEEEET